MKHAGHVTLQDIRNARPRAHSLNVFDHQLSREILDIAASHIKPGVTTDEIDAIVHAETIKRKAYPSPLNYREFPKSVCTLVFRNGRLDLTAWEVLSHNFVCSISILQICKRGDLPRHSRST